jgi:hypothetical protein
MLVRLEFNRMRWRRLVSFAAVLAALVSFASSQVARKTCKGGGKIALEVGYDVSYPVFTYHLNDPKSFSAARIEIWDRPVRLSVTQVPVRKEGQIEWAPKKDPPETPSWLFIRIVDPSRNSDASKVLIGYATNEGGPSPSFPNQSFVFEEGAGWADLVVHGTLLNPVNHFLLTEQETSDRWIARQDLSGMILDLGHVKVEIPPGYLSRPTVLNLQSMPPGFIPPGEQNALPCCGSITVHVMSKDRPVLSGIDPTEISADSMADGVTVRLLGSGFGPDSRALGDLDGDVPDFATKTVFISPNELQVKVDQDYLYGHSGERQADQIQFRVRNSDDLHVSDAQELRILPTPKHPSHAKSLPLITSTSPYPVPLMDFQSPDFLSLTVYGENFRENDYVVLSTDDEANDVKLKTEYVSPQELRALIPRELWKDHRYSFRLVAQTAAGACSTELWEEE